MGGAYYNEIDPFAAAWLRELITAGHIAPGVVDERDIRDVRPNELSGFAQCHFFAGIGVWSYALRRAGWADERPIWTASCPCQPFSDAGASKGFSDPRHLWPTFNDLRTAVRPVVAVGEQVASKDGLAWLDLVQTDVEASGDAFGAVDLCSAGFGAPHIRQRLHWVAYTLRDGAGDDAGEGLGAQAAADSGDGGVSGERLRPRIEGASGSMADAAGGGCGEFRHALGQGCGGHADSGCEPVGLADVHRDRCDQARGGLAAAGEFGWLEHPARGSGPLGLEDDGSAGQHGSAGAWAAGGNGLRDHAPRVRQAAAREFAEDGGRSRMERPGPTNGIWNAADWLFCRDGKWRPVEPGTFPLAHGSPARVGRLRGYGNAINAEVATGFIEAVMAELADAEARAA